MSAIKLYLTLFNVVSTIGWSIILILTLNHLINGSTTVPLNESPYIFFKSLYKCQFSHNLISRARTTYFELGSLIQLVQSFAVLEVLHVLIGFVRSSLPTTAIQVGSRLYIVYYIAPLFLQVKLFSLTSQVNI